jgi:hypothetical protein
MKILIFLPLLLIFVPFILGIVGFFLLVGKLTSNASKDEWEGEVENKSHNAKDGEDDKVEHFYTLIIRTTKGEERKVPVMFGEYEKANIGDKYIKVKGKLKPTRA